MVEIITLGTLTGRARMAAVDTAVPEPPPRPRIPSRAPSRYSIVTTFSAPDDIAASAAPRSFEAISLSRSAPAALASSRRDMVGGNPGSPRTPMSTRTTSCPRPSRIVLMNAACSPFVSSVQRTAIRFRFPIVAFAFENDRDHLQLNCIRYLPQTDILESWRRNCGEFFCYGQL